MRPSHTSGMAQVRLWNTWCVFGRCDPKRSDCFPVLLLVMSFSCASATNVLRIWATLCSYWWPCALSTWGIIIRVFFSINLLIYIHAPFHMLIHIDMCMEHGGCKLFVLLHCWCEDPGDKKTNICSGYVTLSCCKLINKTVNF